MKQASLRPEQIRQYLLSLVYSTRESSALIPSERELCTMFDVTRPTVRIAIQSLVDHGMLEVRRGSGTYIIPQAIYDENGLRLPLIAVFMENGHNMLLSRFYGELYAASMLTLLRNGVQIFNASILGGSLKEMHKELCRLQVDGVIWIRPSNLKLLELLESRAIPVVSINTPFDPNGFFAVNRNLSEQGICLGERLKQDGIRNFLFVQRDQLPSDAELLKGVRTVLKPKVLVNKSGWENELLRLLERYHFDVVYADDMLFSSVLTILKEKLPPEQLPLMISADFRMKLSPNVRGYVLDSHLEQLGQCGAKILLERLQHPETQPYTQWIECKVQKQKLPEA